MSIRSLSHGGQRAGYVYSIAQTLRTLLDGMTADEVAQALNHAEVPLPPPPSLGAAWTEQTATRIVGAIPRHLLMFALGAHRIETPRLGTIAPPTPPTPTHLKPDGMNERGVFAMPFTSMSGEMILVAVDSRARVVAEQRVPAYTSDARQWSMLEVTLDHFDPVPGAVPSPAPVLEAPRFHVTTTTVPRRARGRAPRPPTLSVVRGGASRCPS